MLDLTHYEKKEVPTYRNIELTEKVKLGKNYMAILNMRNEVEKLILGNVQMSLSDARTKRLAYR
jgi:hypothetical protein